jgi:transcription factor RLM1
VAKTETGPRSQSIDVAAMNRAQVNGVNGHPPPEVHVVQPTNGPSQPQRTASTPVMSSVPPQPPSRTNSLQTNRPRLKVQIPNEGSDDEKQTGGSSPHVGPNNAVTPIRAGAVLPPPSPSAASALLSAGASGPPNPFARPAPPATNGTFGGNRSDLETPISALPSRFMSEQLLGSPGSFDYWSFGKDNTLPSPLAAINFGQTPVAQNGPSFRDDDPDRKRKVSDPVEENMAKRIKA